MGTKLKQSKGVVMEKEKKATLAKTKATMQIKPTALNCIPKSWTKSLIMNLWCYGILPSTTAVYLINGWGLCHE